MKIELRFTEKSFSAVANLSFDNSAVRAEISSEVADFIEFGINS